ncbi:hypothetical protein M885DRAFT_223896 [Pelagophyceae sp. CCMP2097]|nr:hypothetical protein M885DRAFT_223896 [Pelagophyceae sp. CCMP2097]|mmetsp:Transcript_17355/g.58638  ORF Transcript_17355/g.58638 Transcript_17355/m.58638 type:complete len:197 (+) Transcript_17355:1028-1618(+)
MKSLLKKREHAHDALERLRASSGRQLGLLARSAAEAASKSGADRNRFAAANREADEARADAAALRASLAKRLGKALRASSTEADRAAGLAARLGQAEKVLQRCQAELAKVRKAPRGAADPASRDADSAADRATIRELRAKICCNVCLDREKTTVLTRCFHAFCRPCVDSMLHNRARKCPACHKAFGAADIKDLFLV